uniref:Uncharacterized protein n=1 Tax=Fagus sylvatica TaxID=28930 RepID=A0A2N9GYT4_FAGSY
MPCTMPSSSSYSIPIVPHEMMVERRRSSEGGGGFAGTRMRGLPRLVNFLRWRGDSGTVRFWCCYGEA